MMKAGDDARGDRGVHHLQYDGARSRGADGVRVGEQALLIVLSAESASPCRGLREDADMADDGDPGGDDRGDSRC